MSQENSENLETLNFPVVGIGCSAGGLEALQTLLRFVPEDTGMAYVVVQHLKRNEKSSLASILAQDTTMKVTEITDRISIRPNTIYVIPPENDVFIEGNRLVLQERGQSEFKSFSIDFFFSSLAHACGSKSIGVLLSGANEDGTLGLKSIKGEGGVSVVQDPHTARFDSMPGSAIASGVADLILAPQDIGQELGRMAKHPFILEAVKSSMMEVGSDEGNQQEAESLSLKNILDLLLSHTKLDFSQYKMTTFKRRVRRQMMLRKIETIEKYAEYLKKNSDEVKSLYEDIFIHVTEFFRDPDAYLALVQTVFPKITQDRSGDKAVRIWVPGCATGEEAYSLAIAMVEYLEEHSLQNPLFVFAGDISEPAIQQARKAVYPETQMSNVSKKRLKRFFEPVRGGFKVKKEIRDLCIFSRHDVTSNPPIPKVDLISCRNLLIYFSSELQKKILPVFHYALNENGYLWLGRAESTDSVPQLFSTVDKINKIFLRENAVIPIQPKFSSASFDSTSEDPGKVQPVRFKKEKEDSAKSLDQVLLYRYSPPSVLVNHELEILQFRGRTIPYLEPQHGSASYNLLKMVNPQLIAPLRICIQSARKDGTQVRKENISFEFEGKKRRVSIDVLPLNASSPNKERQLLIVFEEARKPAKKKTKTKLDKTNLEKDQVEVETLTQYVTQLQSELDEANDYQQALVEEYEAAQEELTSTNEELRSTNEELQSTNEELHSANEELGTAKEEIQATNEELLSINEEVQKRNFDLEQALKKLELSERRFRLMIEGVRDYAIFMLDPEGYITTWNEGAERMNGYKPNEIIGSHFSRFYGPEDIARKHPEEELAIAKKTGKYEEEAWRVRRDGTKFWANVLITAVRDSEGKLLGFSKVTRDLTERKLYEESLRRSEERFRLMIGEVKDYAILMLDPTGHVMTWNEGARRLKGYREEEIIGQHFSKFYLPEEVKNGRPEWKLEQAAIIGRIEDEGWRLRKDGTKFWANVVITRLTDGNGKIIGFVKITRDLTDRKNAEQTKIDEVKRVAAVDQALENERMLDQIFSEAPSFMTLLSVPEFRYLKSNEQHMKLIRRRDIIGRTLEEVEPDIKAQGFIQLLEEVVRTGKPYIGREVKIHYDPVGDQPAKTVYLDFVYQPVRRPDGQVYAIAAQGYEVTEKVLYRKAIENERENFRNLFKQTPEMVCILKGPEHVFEFVNEAHIKALGFDATGMKVREAQPESVEVHGILDEVYKTGRTAELHEIPVTLTDRVRYFNLTYSARRDERGQISGVMILGVEVTDQVDTRRLIERSSEQFRRLADSISHIVWIADPQGKVEYYNRRWVDYTGIATEKIDNSVWPKVLHPEDYSDIQKGWTEAIANRTTFQAEWRMRDKDGNYRWHLVRTIPSFNSQGQITGWFGTSTDIDDQKKATQKDRILADATVILSRSLDLEQTLQSLADVLVEHLADWCSIDLVEKNNSPRRAAVAHPDPKRLKLVQELLENYPTDWSSPTGAAQVLRSGVSEIYSEIPEALLKRSAKDERHFEIIKSLGLRSAIAVPLVSRERNLGVMTLVASESGRRYSDKDLKLAEELGRRAGIAVENALLFKEAQQAIQARDEFLSIASHELKTPLTALRLQAQITNHNLSKGDLAFFSPERLRGFANQVDSQVSRLNQLVDDMLDVSRIQSGKLIPKFERFNLADLALSVCEQLSPIAKAAGCAIQTSLKDVAGEWDRHRIEQVLMNLITNSIKYGAGKPIEVKVYPRSPSAVVEVRDQGIGINKEHHDRIFERFERAVDANGITGLGLGLYISKNIVQAHQGSIRVESEAGKGATFIVQLPAQGK
jgi:PAS domain S-box-containing protein